MSKLRHFYWILGALVLLASGGAYWLQEQASQTVAVVEEAQVQHRQTVHSEYENHDQQVKQKLQLRLIHKVPVGQSRHLTLTNVYYESQATSNRYFVGSHLRLHYNSQAQNWQILGPQRSGVWLAFLAVIIIILLGWMQWSGLRALISVALNLACFVLALMWTTHLQNQQILLTASILAGVMTILTLGLIFGWSQQFAVTLGATLVSTGIAIGISVLVLQLSHDQGIYYETMDYGIQPFKLVFLAETILGVLGAVMDETGDITASMQQLLQEKATITRPALFRSGLNVGREILGPLINILFYIFLAELIPLVVLYLRNGNTLAFSLSRTMTLGYTQTVVSAIALVLAVPLTAGLAALWLRGSKKC
ncbi:YibE/F family protein [Lactobacillus sp. DCY120]|uniref:YibE/F family protein n=1 Tax=Bombilactobacillus apium TaxID=2675299 RepID=A0A850QXK1_9LACO|nr:YibE/F family protein [Bombilactobacillus apium]NVY96544.1 YibE/F family protein [Bombilactobacillus apium]